MPATRGRSDAIDCLRGFLALWVLFAHLIPWAEQTSGAAPLVANLAGEVTRIFQSHGETNPAVLGFIVLSGYCIHRNGFRAGKIDLVGYGIRRAFRIWPVYVLAVAVGAALFTVSSSIDAGQASVLTGTTTISATDVLLKAAAVSALFPGLHVETFQGNAPLTTVAAEIWLYVAYAVIGTTLLRRRMDRTLWVGLGVVWAAGMLWVSRHPADAGWWQNGSLIGFLPYWWLGAKFTDPSFAARRRGVIVPLVIAWLLATLALTSVATAPLWAVEARKLLLALLLGAFVAWIDQLRGRGFEHGARIGQAGYSIYAFHAPIIVVLLLSGLPWPVVALVAVAIGVGVFRAYERPLTMHGARLGRRASDWWRHQEACPAPAMHRQPIAPAELMRRLDHAQADPEVRQDLSRLAGETTDDLDPIR